MVGYRVDTRYCSSPCRQRAYRARAHGVTDIAVTEGMSEEAFAAAAANLTDEQFDEALAAARVSGDLSRSGVARHFPPRQRRVTDIDGG